MGGGDSVPDAIAAARDALPAGSNEEVARMGDDPSDEVSMKGVSCDFRSHRLLISPSYALRALRCPT